MKIAVTGATGFIGRHVLAELESNSVETVAIARTAVFKSEQHANCRFCEFDLHSASSNTYEHIGRPDVLIHLAWSGLPNYKSNHHFERELPGQYRFLRSLIESGLQTVVVAGTCFEYGMQSGPLIEEMGTHPENPYGFAKDALRRQLEFLQVEIPYRLTWARLFYLYGEGQAENSLLPQLTKAVERGDQVFNMTGGEQLRDYLPVADAARYLVSLALKKTDAGVVNVCSGVPVSVRKLVERWVQENNWAILLNLGHYPYPDYEPMAFWGVRDKLDRLMDMK